MIVQWTNLTTRLGETLPSPSLSDLQAALRDLFANAGDTEHLDTWIECGSDSGPLASLSVFSSGKGLLTMYSDVDMTDELLTREYENLTEEEALVLWQGLMTGETG